MHWGTASITSWDVKTVVIVSIYVPWTILAGKDCCQPTPLLIILPAAIPETSESPSYRNYARSTRSRHVPVESGASSLSSEAKSFIMFSLGVFLCHVIQFLVLLWHVHMEKVWNTKKASPDDESTRLKKTLHTARASFVLNPAFLLKLAYSHMLICLFWMTLKWFYKEGMKLSLHEPIYEGNFNFKTHSDATKFWANFCYFHQKGHPLVLQYEVLAGKDSDWSSSKFQIQT